MLLSRAGIMNSLFVNDTLLNAATNVRIGAADANLQCR